MTFAPLRAAAVLAATAALTACGPAPSGPDAGAADGGATLGAFELELLAAHDAERAQAVPTPSPALPAMGWHAQAAATAARWAAGCRFQHNPALAGLGENIFAASGTGRFTPTQVVQSWASEKANYDYAANTCAVGRTCGHYTQVVWRTSVGLGCARQACTQNSPFGGGAWEFWVCDYAPAGNLSGARPY